MSLKLIWFDKTNISYDKPLFLHTTAEVYQSFFISSLPLVASFYKWFLSSFLFSLSDHFLKIVISVLFCILYGYCKLVEISELQLGMHLLPRLSVFPQSGYWKYVFINFLKHFKEYYQTKFLQWFPYYFAFSTVLQTCWNIWTTFSNLFVTPNEMFPHNLDMGNPYPSSFLVTFKEHCQTKFLQLFPY